MKVCLFTDVHWSKNTSIVRSRGEKYSTRLELLINSMNWVNDLAVEQNCTAMFCLGDFFDKSTLDDEEISALREIKWNKLYTYYIVGNHESSVSSLEFSTTSLFRNNRVRIISKPTFISNINGCIIVCLPYITDDSKKYLNEYLKDFPKEKKIVVLSHNDIKGIKYGAFESKTGFDINEIEANCDLYINGHLHNGAWITNTILNAGSLSAHNFTNDSYAYRYGAWILDTTTLELTFYENPYSLNFYKIDIDNEKDFNKFTGLKNNAVVSVKCREDLADAVRNRLVASNIIESKLMLYSNTVVEDTSALKDVITSDHLVKFRDFILSRDDISNIDIFKEELLEVCK